MAIKNEFILKKFGDPIKGADEGIKKSINETLAKIVTQAKFFAPVNKQKGIGGQLRNSIMWRGPKEEGGFNDSGGDKAEKKLNIFPVGNEGYVGTSLDYGVYQEFGTRFMKPQPFLRPAIALVGGKSKEFVMDAMNEEMKSAIKKGKKIVKFF